jgi:Family of unknown function (DUF5868)
MAYIINNKLNLGNNAEKIQCNLDSLLQYIYKQLPLDYDKMKEIYRNVKVPMDYDYLADEKEIHHYIRFVNNPTEDEKYAYKFDSVFSDTNYKNKKFINEVHAYLIKKNPKELRLENISEIELLNCQDMNEDARGIRDVDWKLHFWKKFRIANLKCINLDDLIMASYKIRSHKFENWYEMFTSIRDCQITNSGSSTKLRVAMMFDHGS